MIKRKFSPTTEQVNKVIELRNGEHENGYIEKIIGITTYNLWCIIQDNKLPNVVTKQTIDMTPRILELHNNNLSNIDIAKMVGLNVMTVGKVLHEHGIYADKVERTPELDEKIILLRLDGISTLSISKQLDIGKTTVRRILKQYGYTFDNLPPTKKKPKPLVKICRDCTENGEQSIDNFSHCIRKSGKKKGQIYTNSRCQICAATYNARKSYIRYNKKKSDASFRLRNAVSKSIRYYLKSLDANKNGSSCFDFLPYTVEQLKQHIETLFEPWMNWNNYGAYKPKEWNDRDPKTWKWSLDHIVPQSSLLYSTMTEENFQKCWALSNLRPYNAKQNTIDGSTKVRHICI